ncbi:MAG: efflux transporter outer membrane subunit [Limisphaerales bacterium]
MNRRPEPRPPARRLALVAAAAGLALAGCTLGPDYARPPVLLPDRVGMVAGESLGDVGWRSVFRDAVLQALITESLVANRDLVRATYRIEEAAALLGVTRSQYFPTLDGGASFTRLRASEETGFLPPGANPYSSVTALSGVAQWELDLWGRIRRGNEAARARLLASEFDRDALRTSLIAAVAAGYLDLRAFDDQLAVARKTVTSRLESHELMKLRAELGDISELELGQSEVLLREAEVAVPRFERVIALQEHALSVLLGRNPGPIPRGGPLDALQADVAVAAGLPAALIERRPDILAAEQQLAAFNAEIGVARAAYFPTVILTGQGGVASAELSDLFTGGATAWAFSPQLTVPIFNAGRIRSNVRGAEARQQQAVAGYEAVIQTAFREVFDALVSHETGGRVVDSQSLLVAALDRVAGLAQERYDNGLSGHLEVLDAERNLFSGELALTEARRQLLGSVVDAYRALGGGWKE